MIKKRNGLYKILDYNPPLGIKLIAFFLVISTLVIILAGVGLISSGIIIYENKQILSTFVRLILAGNTNPSLIENFGYEELPIFFDYAGPVLVGIGVALIIFSIARLYIGFHLWCGKTWTRVVLVSFCLLWISLAIYTMAISGINYLNIGEVLFNSIILSYVLFSVRAKRFFDTYHNK